MPCASPRIEADFQRSADTHLVALMAYGHHPVPRWVVVGAQQHVLTQC